MSIYNKMETSLAILGCDGASSKEEIKKQYRKLAMKTHPDVNDSPDAETEFKKINEAYEYIMENLEKNPQSMVDQFLNKERMKREQASSQFKENREFKERFYKGFIEFMTFDGSKNQGLYNSFFRAYKGLFGKLPTEKRVTISMKEAQSQYKLSLEYLAPNAKGVVKRVNGTILHNSKYIICTRRVGQPMSPDEILVVHFQYEPDDLLYFREGNYRTLKIEAKVKKKVMDIGGSVNVVMPHNDLEYKVTIKPNTKNNTEYKVRGIGLRDGDRNRHDVIILVKRKLM